MIIIIMIKIIIAMMVIIIVVLIPIKNQNKGIGVRRIGGRSNLVSKHCYYHSYPQLYSNIKKWKRCIYRSSLAWSSFLQ